MLDKSIVDKVKNILNELPVEGPCLDYKENYSGYRDKFKKSEFIKDLCGFLNSIDGYKKDKFIIVGVSDDLQRKGVNPGDVIKDTDFQDMAEYISPRPSVITGTLIHDDGNLYGYIYIPGVFNNNHVYSINKDFPNINSRHPDYPKYKIVRESTSYIRSGSKNRFIQESDRRSIYRLKYETMNIMAPTSSGMSNGIIIRKLALIGSWNDHNDNDKKMLSKYLDMKYEEINLVLKNFLVNMSEMISYEKGIWTILNAESIIMENAKFYHEDDINDFYKIVVEINKEYNPKYDLNKGIRQFANIYGKTYKFSNVLRISVLKTLIILKSNETNMLNCKSSIRNFEYNAIKDIVDISNWKSIISSSELLIYFAELSPKCYLDFVNHLLDKDEVVKELIEESEDVFLKKDYLTEIVSGLLLTIQLDAYFVESCILLIKLSKYDEKILDRICLVFLPWHPQTMASAERRINALKSMFIENYDMSRKLISKLLPGQTTLSYNLPKFAYMFDFEYKEISLNEYYNNQFDILKLACEMFKANNDDIIELLDLTQHLNKEMFQFMIREVKNKIDLLNSSKYNIWEWLFKYINRYNKYHKNNASDIEKENVEELKILISELYDDSFELLHYFERNEWDLIDEFKNEEKDLLEKRKSIIKKIYDNSGFEKILSISKVVNNSFALGYTLSSLHIINDCEKKILRDNLDSSNKKMCDFSCGFIKNEIIEKNIDIDKECDGLTNLAITNLLLQCKPDMTTWLIAEKRLTNKKKYWTTCFVRFLKDPNEVNYACKMKIKYNEFNEAINIIYNAIMDEIEFNIIYAYDALNGLLKNQKSINISYYTIQKIISYMQEKKFDENKLFGIEWSFMNLMDDDCRPLTIEKMVASNPEIFVDLLSFAYKGAGENKRELSEKENTLATNAYSIINKCKIVPGTLNGCFDSKEFKKWINKALKLAKEKDRIRIAKNIIGKILFFSPEDSNLWINKDIATFINEESNNDVREGFNTNAFNTIGVINCDGTGSVYDGYADKYTKKAEELEKYNLNNFAKSLRSLSSSFRIDAEREREGY